MNRFKLLMGPARVPFLLLPPVCVAVGVGTAFWQTGSISWGHVLLILLGALSAHVSVNAFNEYFDFRSGLDARTQRTPFSGGSGTLPAHPELAGQALAMAVVTLLITAGIGAYFTWLRGWPLLPLGLFGLLLVVTYTVWLVYNPLACLLAPGLGFGVLMVLGTHYALTGAYTWTAFLASLTPTALVSNLLLLNQFPDVEADQSIGRRHYPIRIGRRASTLIYGFLLDVAYGSVILGVLLRLLPAWSLLALLTTPIAWKIWTIIRRNPEDIPALAPAMGMNVLINLLTPLFLAIGLFLG